MDPRARPTGIECVGPVPWGTHLCQFYETSQDLIVVLVPYFRTGLENNEFCVWVTSEPLAASGAERAAREAIPDFDSYLERGQVEIVPHHRWFLVDGTLDLQGALERCVAGLERALARGREGLRIAGNTAWLERKDWQTFADYEEQVDRTIDSYRAITLCAYPLEKGSARDTLDVVRNHRCTMAKRRGRWELLESARLRHAGEALRESEERYRAIFENTGTATIIFEEDGTVSVANAEFARLSGYAREEIEGKKRWPEFVAPHELERLLEYRRLRTVDPESAPRNYEFQGVDRAGDVRDMDATVALIPGTGRTVVSLLDVTERKQAEEEIRELNQHLEYRVQERTVQLEATNRNLQVEIEERQRAEGEIRRLNQELEQRVQERTAQLEAANRELGAQIEERNRAEARIASLARFSSEDPSPVLRIALDGRLLYANEAALSQLPGWSLQIGAAAPPTLRDVAFNATDDPTAQRIDLEHGKRVYSFFVAPIADAGYVNLYGHDVTERREAAEEIRRQSSLAHTLLRTAARLNSEMDLAAVANIVSEEAAHALDVPLASLRLYDEERDEFPLVGGFGLPAVYRERARPLPRGSYDELRRRGRLLVIEQAPTVPALAELHQLAGMEVRTVVAVSVERGGEPIAILSGGTLGKPRHFSEDELALLKGVADQAAQAIANARLFEEARVAREQLRALSIKLVEAREAEQRRIARELHDEIGQLLTALKLSLVAGQHTQPEAQVLVDELLARVRNLSLDLRPAMLDDLGLLPGLLWLFERHGAQTRMRVNFEHSGLEGRRFEPAAETAVYRITQEALTNTARHARVSDVTVRCWATQRTLGVQIRDRGAGFDPEAALAAGATGGLIGMRERARLLGGHLTIESRPGAGTRLTAELPLVALGSGREGE